MSEFFNSVKADLLDRRMLPLVAVVVVVLVAALGYAVFGGGSSSTTRVVAVSTGSAPVTGLATSPATHEEAVAETTNGTSAQHGGKAHNPFTPLPEPKSKTAASSTSAVSSTSATSAPSSSSSSGSSAKGSGESAPAPAPKPATPSKPKTVYHVAVLFGVVPVGATPQTVQLTPYENLKLLTPLPSTQPLIVFRGVTAGGKSATFTLVGEAILHGNGACLPSTSQCQAVDLHPGQAEQLEYLQPDGQIVTYELRVVSIASSKATAASLGKVLRGESKFGRALLASNGLVALPFLRYSSQSGVLVFSAPRASASRSTAARARDAAHPRHRR
jgi:hypothetical protein